jgi:adenine-specific DNA-methyltransferase
MLYFTHRLVWSLPVANTPLQTSFDALLGYAPTPVFPSTRYQGSKRKLTDWIWESIKHLEFSSVLDAFGGTGAVAYQFKQMGKCTTYNDNLRFNAMIGRALIENSATRLTNDDIEQALTVTPTTPYATFIADTFADIYFTDDENRWLDIVVQNIRRFVDPFKQALAYFALYQACMVKRPYNLFHRKNLYMRTSSVERSFGNKTTWDTPFETHFRNFAAEANQAIFDNGQMNHAICADSLTLTPDFDLVYIDPPYLNARGTGVDYHGFYHFLEGLTRYDEWPELIDMRSKHRALRRQQSAWHNKHTVHQAFERLFEHYSQSILVISYRDDGLPTRQEIFDLLRRYKPTVVQAALPQQYVLSKQESKELLFIGL